MSESRGKKVDTKQQLSSDLSIGAMFEAKLLTLFCIRALENGYIFELLKERKDLGSRLDDLIFKYQLPGNTSTSQDWQYRYLQAKHRQDTSKMISKEELENDDGKDFSLAKYFRAFCRILRRGDNIQDCIICTTTDFDPNDVVIDTKDCNLPPHQAQADTTATEAAEATKASQPKITLNDITDQDEVILKFESKKTSRYKLKQNEYMQEKMMNEWSNIHVLAKALIACANKEGDSRVRDDSIFFHYHVSLLEEKVIEKIIRNEFQFHDHFKKNDDTLSDGAKQLRQTLTEKGANLENCKFKFPVHQNFEFGQKKEREQIVNKLPLKVTEEDVKTFFNKFIFVVNMPNEAEFKNILQTEDMIKYYPKIECPTQTSYMLDVTKEMASKKDLGYKLKSEDGIRLLLRGITIVSSKYKKELEKEVQFNEDACNKMAIKLSDLLDNKISLIVTPTPKHTAVKVVSSIQKRPEYKENGSFFITKSIDLEDNEDRKRWKNILKLKSEFHRPLIVVCEKDTPELSNYEDLISDSDEQTAKKSKIIIIRDGNAYENGIVTVKDEITYGELNEKFQNAVLEKTITFQGKTLTVGDLVE
ncbi:Uncharacterized protein APZ42_014447, partial [Daphnia magna]